MKTTFVFLVMAAASAAALPLASGEHACTECQPIQNKLTHRLMHIVASEQSDSLDVRDGTTAFDPDLEFKAKRDGTTAFDPDLEFK